MKRNILIIIGIVAVLSLGFIGYGIQSDTDTSEEAWGE